MGCLLLLLVRTSVNYHLELCGHDIVLLYKYQYRPSPSAKHWQQYHMVNTAVVFSGLHQTLYKLLTVF